MTVKAKKYRPSSAGLTFIRLLLIIVCVLTVVLSKKYLSAYPIIMYTVIGIFCSVSFAAGMILLPIIFAKSSYSISSTQLRKTSGMFFIVCRYMKAECVQYVTMISTPLSKYTGLNFILINALGGNMFLPFLSKKDAIEITASLNKIICNSSESSHEDKGAD